MNSAFSECKAQSKGDFSSLYSLLDTAAAK